VKIIVEVLNILAIVTGEIKEGQTTTQWSSIQEDFEV